MVKRVYQSRVGTRMLKPDGDLHPLFAQKSFEQLLVCGLKLSNFLHCLKRRSKSNLEENKRLLSVVGGIDFILLGFGM